MSIATSICALLFSLLPAEVVPVTGAELQQVIAEQEAEIVVVNLWATWCKPCVEEFPELIEFYRKNKDRDVALILVSADFDDQMDKLTAFLASHEIDFKTYIKTGKDMEFIQSFEPVEWQGALPLTIIYDQERNPVTSFNRKVTGEELQETVDSLLE